ncbi:MAG: LysM peptidoglycan-binding domain-containing M23 family metallopeptidase [Spirochaetes bacterium]|nr:LysM peptidoglycan-binding domain-containing M23 family metallopeptidase [Spirochaetota bacterium]
MNGFPLTRYQVSRIIYYAKSIAVIVVIIFLIVNIVVALVKKRVEVAPNSYILKGGFPLFVSASDYLSLIKAYPRDFGVQIEIHQVKSGESLWMIAHKYGISIETIIASNPFLSSLSTEGITELVIPLEDGVLLAIDDMFDAWRMKWQLSYKGKIRGDYYHHFYELFALDKIRFAFYPGCRPLLVNEHMEALFEIKRKFQAPVFGYFTSMFGMRHDSHYGGMAFHNGIDIAGKVGDPIRPVREGIVSFEGWRDGYGKTIVIQHEEGYVSMYGHLSKIFVKKGDLVSKETVIGLLGTTGRSTGPHLHFIMSRHGEYLNPLLFIW